MAYITGTVLDDTSAAVGGRTVRAYRRDTGALLGETTTASGTVAGDSSFSSVVLLLHGDGADGSTAIVDSSPSPKTVTAYGDAQISTAQSKFGGSSLLFDGTGDYLVADTNCEVGSSDLTVEFFIRTTTTNSYAGVIGKDDGAFPAGAWAVLLNGNGSGSIQLWNSSYSTGAAMLSTSTIGVNDGSWHHIAIVRNGSAWALYKDGTSAATATWSGTVATLAQNLNIGRDPGYSRDFNGYLDEIRVTVGAARYTANFTAPSVAFPAASLTLSTGGYYISTSHTSEVNVVTLDDSGGTTYNDLILRTTPV